MRGRAARGGGRRPWLTTSTAARLAAGEGYALYPYTPTSTKNATPTPFGIVYPPAYAEALTTTYDELALRCALQAPPDAILAAAVRFLVAAGERHQAQERTIELRG